MAVWDAYDKPVAAVFTESGRVVWLVDVDGAGELRLATCTTGAPVTCTGSVDLGSP